MSIIDSDLESVRKLLDATAERLKKIGVLLLDEIAFDKGNGRARMARSTAKKNDVWMECWWHTGDVAVDLVICMDTPTEDHGPVAVARLKKIKTPDEIIDFWLKNRPSSQF